MNNKIVEYFNFCNFFFDADESAERVANKFDVEVARVKAIVSEKINVEFNKGEVSE